MVDLRVLLSIVYPAAFLCQYMDQDRLLRISCQTENRLEFFEVMSVHGSQVIEPHGAEHIDREQFILHFFLQIMVEGIHCRHPHKHIPVPALKPYIPRPDPHSLQQTCSAANIRVDRHIVVIKDDDHGFPAGCCGCQALVGQSARQRAVTDHGDDVIVLVQQSTCFCHAHGH